ncbi:transthyretin-like family protein [Pseudoalteromonas rhizosphaerae]|uniref:Uncharacterized protein n=1 Tax=Pseudoalteromonas rhizosphaerae TaxID=2518973 RepID=A0ABW8KV52_9GAMM
MSIIKAEVKHHNFWLNKKYSVHMCSEVKGALIKRSLKFAHKIEKEDQVITALDGSF